MPERIEFISPIENAILWRDFSRDSSGPAGQSHDWTGRWIDCQTGQKPVSNFLAVAFKSEQIEAILPLEFCQLRGFRICRWAASEILAEAGGLFKKQTPAARRMELVERVISAIPFAFPGIDAVLLEKMPYEPNLLRTDTPLISWRYQNPMFSFVVDGDFLDWEKGQRPPSSRNRLRRYENRLSIAHGDVKYSIVNDPNMVRSCMEAFFRQRAQASVYRNVPDPFSGTPLGDFLLAKALDDAPQKDGLKISALMAGNHIIAVSLSLERRCHSNGYANSYDHQYREFSPGKLLARWYYFDAAGRGIRSFDLGLGNERYKLEWANLTWLTTYAAAFSMKGRLFLASQLMKSNSLLFLKKFEIGRKFTRKLRNSAGPFREGY